MPSVAAAALGAAEGWGSAAAAGASAAAAAGPRPVGSSRTTTTLEPATEINSGGCYSLASERREGLLCSGGNKFLAKLPCARALSSAQIVAIISETAFNLKSFNTCLR